MQVFKVTLNGQVFALKQANPTRVATAALAKERDALEVCDHPNIIGLEAVGDDNRCLVLELCTGGTLEDRLQATRGKRSKSRGKSRRQPMPARRVVQICLEIMRAVQHMHAKGLCHGDIKSSNILLATKAFKASTAGVRLADLGFCRKTGSSVSSEDGGSAPFICRELQLGLDSIARETHDIFACGVVMLDLACTQKPYEDMTVRDFDEAVEEGTLYSRGTVPLAEFKNKEAFRELSTLFFEMLSHMPEERPTAYEAVRRLEAIAAHLDGQKAVMRSARQCDPAAAAKCSDHAGSEDEIGSLAAASDAFILDDLPLLAESSEPAITPLCARDWHKNVTKVVQTDTAGSMNPARHLECARRPADMSIYHFLPQQPASETNSPSPVAASCPDNSQMHDAQCSVTKDGLCHGEATCCTGDAHLRFEARALKDEAVFGGAVEGMSSHVQICGQVHEVKQFPSTDAAAATDRFWSCGVQGEGRQGSMSVAARSPLTSSSPGGELRQSALGDWPCVEALPTMLPGSGSSNPTDDFSVWSRIPVVQQPSVCPMNSGGAFDAGWGSWDWQGRPFSESQSAVQPGWAPSRLEDLSPRNAMSEALAISPCKQAVSEVQVQFVSSNQDCAQEECGHVWSPW